jgi:cysteinyl-tRNA synthetase
MKLYNTLTKRIEDFIPYDPNEIKMYTCGPTVYHYAHIGNLRTYVFEDILEKSLKYSGYHVKRAMNITDVGHLTSDADTGEDKMLKGARRENKTVYEIAEYYTEAFFNDCDKLNIKRPEIVEKATDHIEDYIEVISYLLDKGIAYHSNGNIYFDVSKSEEYYQLSGKNKEDLIIGARDDVTDDSNKKNAQDFGLWFTKSKFDNQEMKWDSPFGVGYPGWHIECSSIALKYLGDHLDIHCGGVDNIFPHHSNEIAQSEAYLGQKWCSYWLHAEHLHDDTGKMSKSSGETLTLSVLIEKGYDPLAYRYLCLTSHYRKQLVFTYDTLDSSLSAYNKLKNKIKSMKNEVEGFFDAEIFNEYVEKFKLALEDDLNTANALTVLYDLLKSDVSNYTKLKLIESFDKVLSLDLLKEDLVSNDLKDYIEAKINERNNAKANKDYAKADQIRDELLEQGIIIKDTKEKTLYEIKK